MSIHTYTTPLTLFLVPLLRLRRIRWTDASWHGEADEPYSVNCDWEVPAMTLTSYKSYVSNPNPNEPRHLA